MTKKIEIKLSQVSAEATDTQAPALAPGQEPQMVIVEQVEQSYCIVDGFHRVAGYVAWAAKNGLALDDLLITVVCCDDDDLIAAAAEPGPDQGSALESIYEQI